MNRAANSQQLYMGILEGLWAEAVSRRAWEGHPFFKSLRGSAFGCHFSAGCFAFSPTALCFLEAGGFILTLPFSLASYRMSQGHPIGGPLFHEPISHVTRCFCKPIKPCSCGTDGLPV